jgi:hypothetical protein
MPQGCAKRIQFQLLLADFALELFDPPTSLRWIGEVGWSSRRLDRCRIASGWTTGTAHRRRTAGLKMITPTIQHPALHAQFIGQTDDALGGGHALHRGELERLGEASPRLTPHTDLISTHSFPLVNSVPYFRVSV